MTDATFWDDRAEDYARKPVEDPDAFERKIDLTRRMMSRSDTLLEIGCGTGSLALRLAPSARRIHGLDLSGEMIRIARSKTAEADLDNLSFEVGSFDEDYRAFEPHSLDGALAFSVLHLMMDREPALKKIHSLLKPGGYLVSSTVCLGESWLPLSALLWVMRRLNKAPEVAVITKARLLEELAEAGFVDIETPDVGAKATIAFVVARKPGG